MKDPDDSIRNQRGAIKRPLVILLSLIALFLAYQGVMAAIRAHVDDRIEENVGDIVPAVTLSTPDGAEVDLGAARGRVLILNFFRSHCPSCVAEKPAIRAFAAELDPKQAVLYSLLTDPVMGFSPEDSQRTLERAAYEHEVLLADQRFLDEFHGATWARVTPVTYFVDHQGKIIASLRGTQTLESLRAAYQKVAGS